MKKGVDIPNKERAIVLQGGGSLGAYGAGAYSGLSESLSKMDAQEGNKGKPIFDIIAGTMQASQAQQEQINQAQTQAAQAQHSARAAQALIQGKQGSNPGKKDPIQELERLGNLKQQGLLTEEEFKKLKIQLLSGS